MRPIRNPDEVLWRLLELKRQLYTLKAQTHIARVGYAWVPKCRLCSHKHRVPTLDGGYQCEKCGEPWELEKVHVPKSPSRHPSRYEDPRIHLISQADTLARVLELPRWDQRVYLETFIYERRTFLGAARHARRRWPSRANDLTDKKVRTQIERCRRIIVERLETRGLV